MFNIYFKNLITFKGAKSLLLLEPTKTDEAVFPEGETHQSFDLLNDNFQIPAETTYYNCRLHKIPDFISKQHLVKVLLYYLFFFEHKWQAFILKEK